MPPSDGPLRPASLEALIEALESLPGIGPRSASRLAHHLLRVPEADALALADAIRDVRARIKPCSRCRAPAERDPCGICSSARRRQEVLLVVETPRDLQALEAAGSYDGMYFVLGGRLSPLDGRAAPPDALEALVERVGAGAVREVVVGTNPDLEGDGTARAILEALAEAAGRTGGDPVRVTRFARGVPTGGQIEFQNAAALVDAFEERRPIDDR